MDQVYRLVGTNPGGCDGVDSVRIRYMKGPEIYVPTAFTPNGDGKNDRLHFYPAGYEPENFTVYNRWGAIVFTTKDVSQGWDGKLRGKEQPTGVYIWTVSARAYDGTKVNLKGTVTLIR